RNEQTQQVYTEFGGKRGKYHNGFLPTAETAMFILAGNDLEKRFALLHLFSSNHVFFRHNILQLEEVTDGEPVTNGALVLAQDILDMFTTGKVQRPKYSGEFPAQQLSTSMDWEDLVLNPGTLKQYQEIEIWLQHEHKLMREWGMERKLKPGYKSLFFGPPGTGKTLTAALLGKKTGRDVFKIDLSRLVSKYIGETEKNLSKVFNKAEHKDWILFFDEADSLFSKRTGINDAHDRYANQEVSYLLQRMEEYNGLIILATNLKSNVDDAFLRRFQSIIHFPMPTAPERLEIWRKGFSEHVELDAKVDLKDIASKYELSGGPIMNVIQYACLMALNRDSNLITQKDIMDGIRKEFGKSGRTA
ncbi:MAG: ATP-binding protein, partial [Flavobacteriales bacterium]|nr:ATP-binding protein [Flavobacteriales bacterium]